MKRVAITTLGCKVNQFESAAFASAFTARGCQVVPLSSEADIYVVNTCTVTGRAAQQSRQLIRRIRKQRPQARIFVTGCFAQMDPEGVLALDEAPLAIVGNGNKHRLVDAALAENPPDMVMLMGRIRENHSICDLPVTRFSGRTRAYLRIQDGCDNFCAYCIVPYTRGPSRSLALAKVLEQTATFVEQGYREVVITGINVGKYGLDLDDGETIYSLLDRLCRDFPDLRLRLSSIEPTEVNDTLLELINRHANFMPHLHIPLQSGDDQVLARMNRRYSRSEFTEVIHCVRAALPTAAIGCDVLGGFPGETEAEAENTYQLLAELPISYLHVFPYSRRPGTLAASMPHHLPGPVKEARVRRLRGLDSDKRQLHAAMGLGQVHRVLVERRHKSSGLLQGFSENYIPLLFTGPANLIQSVVEVRMTSLEDGQAHGLLHHDFVEENRQNR